MSAMFIWSQTILCSKPSSDIRLSVSRYCSMANWGVVFSRNPLLNRKSKKRVVHNHDGTGGMQEERVEDLINIDVTPYEYGRVFHFLCPPGNSEHDCTDSGCERITINVSGMYFVTSRRILEAHPTTVLGNPEKRQLFYDFHREEYFFDRHRQSFEAIFNYYKYGGKLKRPISVADDVFLDECAFFEIEENVVMEYKREEGYTETVYEYPENPFLAKVWGIFEYPETSQIALFIGLISVIITLISILTFTIETLPRFKPICSKELENDTDFIAAEQKKIDHLRLFFIIETVCNIWFTLEAIIRFIACPNKIKFWKDVKNIIDIVAVVPYYVGLIQSKVSQRGQCESGTSLAFLRVIRLVRVFKLTKHSQGLQILLLTFQSSIEGLTLFFLTLIICILVFSSIIYYVEIEEPNTMIKSIPDGFWWAVITMCTVGYGDVVPVGNLGKVVGTLCALSGVLTLAIPVPIITENFNKFYVHKQRSRQREAQKDSVVEKIVFQLRKVFNCCRRALYKSDTTVTRETTL